MGGDNTPVVNGVYSLGAADLEWTVYGKECTNVVVVLKLNGCAVNAHMFTSNIQSWTPTQMTLGDSTMSISISTLAPTSSQLGSLIITNWTVTTKLDGPLTLSNVAIVSWDPDGRLANALFSAEEPPQPAIRTN